MNYNLMFLLIIIIAIIIILLGSFSENKEGLRIFRFPYFYKKRNINPHYPARTSLKPFTLPIKYLPQIKRPRFLLYKKSQLTPIGNQGLCGSCWAFALTSSIADRIVIKTGGSFRQSLSPQLLLSCIEFPYGCDGGALDDNCLWIEKNNFPLLLNSQFPYKMLNGGLVTQKCPITPETIKDKKVFYIKKDSVKSITEYIPEADYYKDNTNNNTMSNLYLENINICIKNVENMKQELFQNGPFFCAMTVYKDLYDYEGKSIYQHSSGEIVGGHAIEIVGYCESGVDDRIGYENGYWICRNSWGREWPKYKDFGIGYFTVRMGVNECGIESRCGSADPDIPNSVSGKDLSFLRTELY